MRAISKLSCLLLVCLLSAPAAAKKHPSVAPPSYDEVKKGGAQAILSATDDIHFSYKTQEVEAAMKIFEPGDTVGRDFALSMHQDGEKRLIRILAPSEVKGMGILIKDASTMYVYMPEFDKVRRVASHARKQTMLGSDFNYEDMAMSRLDATYDAKIEKETADEVVLLLQARDGQDIEYPKLRVFVSKKTLQMSRQEYFNGAGKHVRTMERSNMKTFESEDYGVQSRIKMIDHTNKDHYTILTMVKFKADHEIPKRLFSKRTLVRGD